MEEWGIGCIGFVFGYLLYYAVRHTEKFDITLLSAAIGAVGSQAVITWLKPTENWIGPYGIGLFAGFISYLFLTLILVQSGQFDALSRIRLLVVSLLGTRPQDK
jgi:hypothetical protein